MTCGIYKLVFKGTNKVYIGQSIHIEKRYNEHISNIKNKICSKKLLAAYLEFGIPSIEIIHSCAEEYLNTYELENINKYNSILEGFNTSLDIYNNPNNIGTNNGMSKYSKEQILKVFNMLLDSKGLSFNDISEHTVVSLGTVAQVACGGRHTWLKLEYPDRYAELLADKSSRTSLSNSAKHRGIQYPQIMDTLGNTYIVEHLRNFAKQYKLDSGCLSRVLNGKAKTHKGWKLA